jgi:hypothetical protein
MHPPEWVTADSRSGNRVGADGERREHGVGVR